MVVLTPSCGQSISWGFAVAFLKKIDVQITKLQRYQPGSGIVTYCMDNDNRPTQSDPTPKVVVPPPQITPMRTAVKDPEPKLVAEKEHSGVHDFLSTIGILTLALAIALLLIGFVFRTYQVDGSSMETTLQNSDKLIIWKVPRTWARITGHNYIPKRGDIIVFEESGLSQYGQEDKKQLIKRVIGLPGDRIVVNDGVLTVYNKSNPAGFQPDKTLSYGADHHIPTTTGNNIDVTLKAGELYACGDNRPDSLDSRTFGPINADQIIGRMVVRVFPLNKSELF
ncbi:MAG: signal peptidase [Candidatus Saccharibacteria bacterium]|nr:signal peptidase [Candidatus Saccharibacteria bacterium]